MNGAPAWENSSHTEFVKYYEQKAASEETRRHFVRLRDTMLLALPPEKAGQTLDVADIGCGPGAFSIVWAELGHRVRGLDVNQPLLDLAKVRAAERGLAIDFDLGSATALPWPDECVDICCMPELLEHVDDWEQTIRECIRVLRPKGALYLSTANALCPVQNEFNLPLYSWYPSRLKRKYEHLARTTRPELANFATYPAVHWFNFYGLRGYLARRGLTALDRFDLASLRNPEGVQSTVLKMIRRIPPLRFAGHVLTPGVSLVAVKDRRLNPRRA